MELEIRALRRPDEVDQLVRMLAASYEHESVETWARVQADLDADPRYTRVGLIGDRIVSTVQIFGIPIRLDGQPVRVGGIAHVATLPDAGAAYAGRVLRDAVALMEREGFLLSMLHTGIPRYYQRLGWWTIPEHVFTVELATPVPPPSGRYQIETYDVDRDAEALAALYARVSADLNGTKVRSRKDWTTDPPWEPEDFDRYLVARDGDDVVAYVRARAGSLDVISELVYDDVAAAGDLLLSLLALSARAGVGSVSGKFPLADVLADRLAEAGLKAQRTVATKFDQFEVTMFRLLDVPGFFQSIRGALQNRLAESGDMTDAAVRLQCRSGEVIFEIRRGNLTIANQTGVDGPLVEVSDAELLELTLGTKCAAEVPSLADLPAEAGRLVAALFPGRPVVFWLPDHF